MKSLFFQRHRQFFHSRGRGAGKVDGGRNFKAVGRASLCLRQGEFQGVAFRTPALYAGVLHLQRRRSRALCPLAEEGFKPPFAGELLEPAAQVFKRGVFKTVLPVKTPQAFFKSFIAEHPPQHVIGHQGLAVPYSLRGRGMPGAEFRKREIFAGRDIVGIFLQGRSPVVASLSSVLGYQVIGQIGRKPLAPVAFFVIHKNSVAPPVMEYLVRVRGINYKGEAYYFGAQQGKRRHPVAGIPEILYQGEFPVGIAAQQPGI